MQPQYTHSLSTTENFAGTAHPTMLARDRIRTDGGTQSRAQLDAIAISEYTGAMVAGSQFPPIVVFHDGDTFWLADGFHRVLAAEIAGLAELAADVRQGSKRDAILYSVGANNDHGVRRTNRDKRTAVELLLKDEEWAQWADREIARKCGVDHAFVGKVRANLSGDDHQIDSRKVTRNGTTYDQKKRIPVKDKPPAAAPLPAWVTDDPLHEPEAEPLPLPAITIRNLDACYLADFVSEPVHLVVTSPPYNVGIDYGQHNDSLVTYFDMLRTVWAECHKVMVDGARIAVVVPFGVGRNPWVPLACQVMDTLTASGFTLRGQIIWDKNTTGNRTSWGSFRMASAPALRDTTECIIVAHKGSDTLPIPPEHLHKDDKSTFTAWLADSEYFMGLAQDHWTVAPESAQRVKHPAPFPVELVTRLIHFYAYPGAHILDPFGGSGTTAIAARRCGCMATLIEIDAEYCRLAEERISNG